MSNKFALSDAQKGAGKCFHFIGGFAIGIPEFMRFKHFRENPAGVIETHHLYL